MEYKHYKQEIIASSMVCGGEVKDKDRDVFIAASAVVLAKKGEEWCIENPDKFAELTIKEISFWFGLLSIAIAFFTGGSTIWFAIAKWLIPIVIDIISDAVKSGAMSATAASKLKEDAGSDLKRLVRKC